MILKNRLDYYKNLSASIEKMLVEGNFEKASTLITEYNKEIDDVEICSQKAVYYLHNGNIEKSIEILKCGLVKQPFNYSLNYNLGFLLNQTGDLSESLKYYIYSLKYADSDEERKSTSEQIESILTENGNLINEYNKHKLILQEVDGRAYPLGNQRNSTIRKVQKKKNGFEYMVNMYDTNYFTDINESTRLLFKTELIRGNEIISEKKIQLDSPAIIPISLINPKTKVDIILENHGESFQLHHLSHNKFHYLKIDSPDRLTVKSDSNIFVGKPIPKHGNTLQKKLVLKIFIDGLSMKFLEKRGIEELMPNTYNFFENGFISKKCYATSEWTLPCKASIHTGKYSTNHKLLHPNYNYDFENYNKLLAEYFSEAGYLTTNICTNWRTTPSFGYYKGFDKIIYQNFLGGMDCKEVITETIENLESFHDINNFLTISIMDLHNVPDEIENHLLAEVNTDLEYRVSSNRKGITSVQTKYDEAKIHKYALEIKRIDIYLGILFSYLANKYNDNELVVVLHSDHGQTFLEDEENILHESRTKIPLMVKAQGVINQYENEIIEMVDILPIILNSSGLPIPQDIDGCLPVSFGGTKEKVYSITQVIHPNQPYRAIIKDSKFEFYFETSKNVNNDLSIYLESYKSYLLESATNRDVSEYYVNIVKEYEDIVYNHIKDFIKWDI